MVVFDDEEVARRLHGLEGWKRDGRYIQRRFTFAGFGEAMEFANQVAAIAERRNHHPFLQIDYRVVTVRYTSWSAGGITALDFDAASEIQTMYAVGKRLGPADAQNTGGATTTSGLPKGPLSAARPRL